MVRLACCLAALAWLGSAVVAAQRPAPEVVAITDTASVRFELRLVDPVLAGAPVHATITPLAGGPSAWVGSLGVLARDSLGGAVLSARITVQGVARWSPAEPALYRADLDIRTARGPLRKTIRIGFRSVEARGGQILLNGRPIFLRGNAINPPGRNLPDSLDQNPGFAAAYLRYLKGLGVNLVRLGSPSQVWFDAADEVGMLVLQGHYGVPRGGTVSRPPRDAAAAIRWYRDEVLAPQASHPSVAIYALSNELAAREIPYLNSGHEAIAEFLGTTYLALRQWDDTRLYLGNAGYGFGHAGELCDLHRYWGWYYNSFLSYYTLRDPAICWREGRVQPITLSENTGSYTGADGRFNLVSDSKQPDSQLNWTGHASEAEQRWRALAYQAWLAGQAIEITRRLRPLNPSLAGLSPFTILFSNWDGPRSVADMEPKPIADQYARSFQPVLLSWELWTPQVYAGTTIRPVAHLVNDDDHGRDLGELVLRYAVLDPSGQAVVGGSSRLSGLRYYAAASLPLAIPLPAGLSTGCYRLRGWLIAGKDTLSWNETVLRIASRDADVSLVQLHRRLLLYDADGRTAGSLERLGIRVARTRDLSGLAGSEALILGADSWDALASGEVLERFVTAGGRVLVLEQSPGRFDPGWLPGGVVPSRTVLDHALIMPGGRPFAQGMAINPEWPDHPVFEGLSRDDFFLWSDPSGWSEPQPGLPMVYPVTRGYGLARPEQLGQVAVLANYDKGLEGVALAEFFLGRGSVLLSGFELVSRIGLDPVADRLLRNLVRYTADASAHQVRPEITAPIHWGDYGGERGSLTGIHSGLLVHTVPRVPAALAAAFPLRRDSLGFVHAGSPGGWNTRPAIQFVAAGRRPFGPYQFTNGGSYQLRDKASPEGAGHVWLRVPAGRTAMVTAVENPADTPLALEITVGSESSRHTIPPRSTSEVTTPLPPAGPLLAISFRGDRRMVLRTTDFR